MDTDHIDGNVLNNQKFNLRTASTKQNLRNRAGNLKSTSKFKGVDFIKRINKYRARISYDGKHIHLGHFIKEKDAARAYNISALKYHGKFAKINII